MSYLYLVIIANNHQQQGNFENAVKCYQFVLATASKKLLKYCHGVVVINLASFKSYYIGSNADMFILSSIHY